MVLEVVRVDGDDERRAVVDEHPALGVEDAAAGRLLGDRADAVGRGRGTWNCSVAITCRYQRRANSAPNSESDHDAEDAEPEAGGISVHGGVQSSTARSLSGPRPCSTSRPSAHRMTRRVGGDQHRVDAGDDAR